MASNTASLTANTSSSDPIIETTLDQIRLATNQLEQLREEEIHLRTQERVFQNQVDELKNMLAATAESIQHLWNKGDDLVADEFGTAFHSAKLNVYQVKQVSTTSAEKKYLALAGEQNIQRQLAMLTESQSQLNAIRVKLEICRKTFSEKQSLLSVLKTLVEDRRALYSASEIKDRAKIIKEWAESIEHLFEELHGTSVQRLCSNSDVKTMLHSRANGSTPGLNDYVKLSQRKIDQIMSQMSRRIPSDQGLVEPTLRQTIIHALEENARLRREVNRISSISLQNI
jgi:hypothetical protein